MSQLQADIVQWLTDTCSSNNTLFLLTDNYCFAGELRLSTTQEYSQLYSSTDNVSSSKQVYNSKGVSTCSPIPLFRAILVLFIKDSVQPFWCVAASVQNCHFIPFSGLSSFSCFTSHPLIISCSSCSAPTNCVGYCEPLSPNIIAGWLLIAKNLRSVRINSIVE